MEIFFGRVRMEFKDRLKSLRNERKMLQKELGDKIGAAASTISGYEQGERMPDYNSLKEISKVFGVTVDYLLGNDACSDIENEFPEAVRLIRKSANKMDPKQKDKLVELMEWYIDSLDKFNKKD
jgi:transcriptional regulator with XRE-family HTH domain